MEHEAEEDERERVEYEADPWHAETLFVQCGLMAKSKGVATACLEIEPTGANMEKISERASEGYRSACMRLGYLALDRPDLQYAAKECARGMSEPITRDGERLKRAVRYLKGHPTLTWTWPR